MDDVQDQTERPNARESRPTRYALIWAAVIAWVLVCATGLWLAFYRPSSVASVAYTDMAELRNSFSWLVWIRRAHNVAAVLAVVVPLAAAAAGLARGWQRRAVASLGGLVVASSAAFVVAQWIPWGQYMLWADTAGSSLWFAFDDNVRFVLLGGVEVDPIEVRRWVIAHTLVLSAIGALCAVAATVFAGRRARPVATD